MKISTKNPMTVSTVDRDSTFVLGNQSFSNGYYAVLSQEMAVVLNFLFVQGNHSIAVSTGVGSIGMDTYNAVKNFDGGIDIGCKSFSKDNVRKIAKWTGAFGKSTLDKYFPKTERTAAGKPKFRTVTKAKAARAGR